MTISNLEIENFKSFGKRQPISFSLPNGSKGSGLTILVGQNNSGKTSVIDAVRLFLDRNGIFEKSQRRGEATPRVLLSGDQQTCTVGADSNRKYGISYDGPNDFPKNVRIVTSRRSWNERSRMNDLNDENYWQQVNSRKDASRHNELLGRLMQLHSNPESNEEFRQVLKSLVPNFGEWTIDFDNEEYFVEYTQDGKLWHRARDIGDGILNLFQLGVAILDVKEAGTLLIDEPELSLHPQAQRSVAHHLKYLSATRQIIVATHSPYFVDFEIIGNGATLHRFYIDGNESRVRSLSTDLVTEFTQAMNDYQKPQLFDIVAKEMFFDTCVMFVEGQEDVGLFRKVARERNRNELPIFGYGIGGAAQIERFMRMGQELGIKCGALLDGTEAAKVQVLQERFKESLIRALPADDIRDKDAQAEKGAKFGVFTTKGELKQVYEGDFLAIYDEFANFFKSTCG